MAEPGANLQKKKLVSWAMRTQLLEGEQHIEVSRPRPLISMITINRPETKNTMTHRTRAQLINQLQLNDQDPDVRVTIIRGAEGNFSAGHDFDSNRDEVLPNFEPEIDGQTSRHVLNTFFMINDLAKPVIAMVEGEAIGGGFELAAACDVCIAAEDATLGYNAVRGQGLADYQILPWLCGMRNAMELILTNSPMTGLEAARRHFATESVPAGELEAKTLELAERIAKIPSDLLAFNKKSVHRAFEAMGMRTNLRNGVDLEALMFKAPGAKMLTARRGPSAPQNTKGGVSVPQRRAPPPRPTPMPIPPPIPQPQAVAVQAVSASSSSSNNNNNNAKPALAKEASKSPASPPAAGPSQKSPVKPVAVAKPAPKATKEQVDDASEAGDDEVEEVSSVQVAPSPAKKTAPVALPRPTTTPTKSTAASSGPAAQSKSPPSSKATGAAAANTTPAKSANTPKAIKEAPSSSPQATLANSKSSTPAKAPSASTKPSTPPKNAATPMSSAKGAEVKPIRNATSSDSGESNGVQIHLHEAVHIHISPKTPSKL